MAQQVINFVTTKTTVAHSYLPDTYQLRRDRGWLWAQRIALWILRKLGCYALSESSYCTRHSIDTGKFVADLVKQRQELMTLYHIQGERLLVGPEQFKELVGVQLFKPLSFTAPYHWYEQGVTTAFGMEVTVIPWMSGILVLPKAYGS